MTNSTRFPMLGAVLFGSAALMLSACTDDAATPTDAEYLEVARSVGASSSKLGDGAAVSVAAQLSTGTLPFGITLDATGRLSGSFLGLDISYQVDCRDVEGQAIPCSILADAAMVDAAWSGTIDLPRLRATASSSGQWQLTGLQTPIATVDGDAQFDLATEFQSASGQATKTLDVSSSARFAAVQLERDTNLFVGGSIDYDLAASASHTTPGMTDERTFAIDATITFAGDGSAALVLDGDHRYAVDLTTGVTVATDAP